jgi:integrase/recombinase XerD
MELQSSRSEDKWLTGFFITKQQEGCSPKTIADYRWTFKHLAQWSAANQRPSPNELTTGDLRAFLVYLRERVGSKSVRNAWVALRSFYRWYASETEKPNPSLVIAAPKFTERVIRPLTREQVTAILKVCDYTREARTTHRTAFAMRRRTALRDKAITLVLVDAGLRASELCGLLRKDVDLASGETVVNGKGGKQRIVYLGKSARRALWRYLKDRNDSNGNEPLFTTDAGAVLSINVLEKLYQRLGERANVPGLHPHQLRHTFATEFLRNGGNLLALQRALGHSTLEMVRRYAEIVDADLARAHETGSPADKWRL